MLGADIVMAHQAGLVYGQLNDPLCPRGKRGLAKWRPFSPAHRPFDGTDDLHRLDTQLAQDLNGDTVLFPH